MRKQELQQLVKLGEDSGRQFKADVTNPDSLAAELVAFSNSRGGTILIGVADDGTLVGLSPQDVRRINQLVGSAATQGVRSPISPRTEIISPGNLPNHLTVEKIRAGNSVIRNPVLATYAAKGVLPYRGLGTGIRRALADWPAVDLIDDRDACTFDGPAAEHSGPDRGRPEHLVRRAGLHPGPRPYHRDAQRSRVEVTGLAPSL